MHMGLITTAIIGFVYLAATLAMAWWVPSILEVAILFALLILLSWAFIAEKKHQAYAWPLTVAVYCLGLLNLTWLYLKIHATGWFLILIVLNVIALLRAVSRIDARLAGITHPVTYEGSSIPDVAPKQKESREHRLSSNQKPMPTQLRASQTDSMPPDIILPEDSRTSAASTSLNRSSALAGMPIISSDGDPYLSVGETPAWESEKDPEVIVEDRPEVQVELETYKEGENAVPIIRQSSKYGKEIDALVRRVNARLNRSKTIKSAKTTFKKTKRSSHKPSSKAKKSSPRRKR